MSDKLQIVTEKDGSRWVPLESYVKSLREVLNAFPGNKQEYIPDQNIIDGGGYVIAGIVKDVFKELERKEDRIRELEAALAGKHEIVCAYCREVFPNDDPKVILEHIQSCDKRPEKAIFETLERMQNMYEKRILLLVNAAGRLVDMHLEDEDNAVW